MRTLKTKSSFKGTVFSRHLPKKSVPHIENNVAIQKDSSHCTPSVRSSGWREIGEDEIAKRRNSAYDYLIP